MLPAGPREWASEATPGLTAWFPTPYYSAIGNRARGLHDEIRLCGYNSACFNFSCQRAWLSSSPPRAFLHPKPQGRPERGPLASGLCPAVLGRKARLRAALRLGGDDFAASSGVPWNGFLWVCGLDRGFRPFRSRIMAGGQLADIPTRRASTRHGRRVRAASCRHHSRGLWRRDRPAL